MIELTLPAGSLQSALQAFAGGADAVYLGLQNYSARKHATNFSWEELSRLKTVAIAQNKRIYITLNTLLDDQELDTTRSMLRRLELLQPDGVIVQDLGLAHLIHSRFPSLALHGSTQLAVHTEHGVRAMQRMGFERVVLSRELTFKEIERIRIACPDVQLKTFIHGAMCYGFSGLCMASHHITGRSANRGECAQICRTWFSHGEHDGYFFSMKDLAVGENVVRLRDIGIDSLKIEGRMKSPSYVRFAAQYYRMILDGASEASALRTAREYVDTQFARQSEQGWTFSYGKELPQENRDSPSLVTSNYPGHQGISVATVVQTRSPAGPGYIRIRLEEDIAIRDGLLWLSTSGTGMEEPVRFGLHDMKSVHGKALFQANRSDEVDIAVPPSVQAYPQDILHRISRHDLNISTISETSIPVFRHPVNMTVTIMIDNLRICATDLPAWLDTPFCRTYPIDVQVAKRPQQLYDNISKVLSTPGEGLVTLGQLTVENTSGIDNIQVFLPLSILKEIRRSWYEQLNNIIETAIDHEAASVVPHRIVAQTLPKRIHVSPPQDSHIPWVDVEQANRLLSRGIAIEEVLAVVDGVAYVPLPPVTFSEEKLFASLEELIERSSLPVSVGLNNVAHTRWASQHPEVPCFADVYLYIANRHAAAWLLETVPNLTGLYRWVERSVQDTTSWPVTPTDAGFDFALPLFISRACFRYDALGLPCEGCPRRGTWNIVQQGKHYRVDVRDCLTVVSEEPEEGRSS